MKNHKVKVLIFDVFGTVVDWRSTIKKELNKFLPVNLNKNELNDFALEWRKGYSDFIGKFNDGRVEWKNVDELHLDKLKELLESKELLNSLDDKNIHEINKLWHKLYPWDDSVEGLRKLKEDFSIGTLSNGNFSLLLNMSKYSKLNWDFIFSGDIFEKYKTNEYVYKKACQYLDLNPSQVMMVAAHEGDLNAAKKLGLKTAYVNRPLEYSDIPDINKPTDYDYSATDFIDLYKKLKKHNT